MQSSLTVAARQFKYLFHVVKRFLGNCSTISYEKVNKIREKVSPWALSSKPYPFTEQCASAHIKRTTRVLGEESIDNPTAPTLSTRFSSMLLFLASTSEKNARGSEISLKTGCWGSSVSVS